MMEPKREPFLYCDAHCDDCAFFEEDTEGDETGHCRRSPPVIMSTGGNPVGFSSKYPRVNGVTGWCGQGQHKDKD